MSGGGDGAVSFLKSLSLGERQRLLELVTNRTCATVLRASQVPRSTVGLLRLCTWS